MTGRSDGAIWWRRGCHLAAIWLPAGILLAACDRTPPSPSAAPLPKAYTCEQQAQLAGEFAGLAANSMLRVVVIDYGRERDELRALHGIKAERCAR